MKTKSNIPIISLTIAEKVLRDIARREGHAVKKRRSRTMIELHGPGYMVYDPSTNCVVSGTRDPVGDGCGDSLKDLAARYEACERNTAWQSIVLQAIKAGRIGQGQTT